jgi:putative flippase GtrA
MALVTSRLGSSLASKARSRLGIRFGRFAVAALAAFVTTEVVLSICAGPLRLTATWATLIAWFSGAVVSYVLSRWAWKRRGRPNLVRETLPFWIVSAMVIVVLTLATKFGYHSSGWLHLRGAERVLYIDGVAGVANLGTFVLRFLFFHYVLFAGSAGQAGLAAAEEALVSTDPGPEPFARAADSTAPMRSVSASDSDKTGPAGPRRRRSRHQVP